LTLIVYLWIVGCVIASKFPVWTLLAVLTLPMAIKAIKIALLHYNNFENMMKAQGANVFVVLVTQALFALGFLIAALL